MEKIPLHTSVKCPFLRKVTAMKRVLRAVLALTIIMTSLPAAFAAGREVMMMVRARTAPKNRFIAVTFLAMDT